MKNRIIEAWDVRKDSNCLDIFLILFTLIPSALYMFIRSLKSFYRPIPYILKKGKNCPFTNDEMNNYMDLAKMEWESASGKDLFIASKKGLVIEFNDVETFIDEKGEEYFSKGGLYLPLFNLVRIWENDCDVKGTLAHELGHVLGFLHSKDKDDLMYNEKPTKKLSEKEKEKVRRRYK